MARTPRTASQTPTSSRRRVVHRFTYLRLVISIALLSVGSLTTAHASRPVVESPVEPSAVEGFLPVAHDGVPLQRELLTHAGILTDDYDPPAQNWLAGHRGIDLYAPPATELRAPQAGTLTFAGNVGGKHLVVVTHPGGLRSTFEPARTTLPVGTSVRAGDYFATVSEDNHSHCAAIQCVHWGLKDGRTYLDPWLLLAPWKTVRLVG